MLAIEIPSGFGRSGSEAKDMLSGETVVGGVELKDVGAELGDDASVAALLEKLEPHSSESSSAIVGAVPVAAIIAARRRAVG